MSVKIILNTQKIQNKVTNDRFGLFVASEWKKLIDPYTPFDTGIMEETARVRPFEIHYIQPYSTPVYYGRDMKFQKKNPYSTYEWDKAAEKAGQKNKLYRAINNARKTGQY
jgi:hypothetical protein